MDTALICRVAQDEAFILALIDSIWEETAEEGAKFEEYQTSPLDLWVELYDPDNELQVGAIRLRRWNACTIQLCIQIKKEYRVDYSKHAPKAIHDWLTENLKDEKMIAYIPDCFPNVIAFATAAGWNREGILTNAFKRDKKRHNIHVFGKLIEEMRQ